MEQVFQPLAAVADQFTGGEVLLWRKWGIISIAGRGLYSHAAIAAPWGSDLMVLEVREWYGGRCVTLESQVRRAPNRIDVYRVHPQRRDEVDKEKLIAGMRNMAGCDYGYWHILGASALHLPGIRLFTSLKLSNEHTKGHAPFCSEAVGAHFRWSGLDLIPNLPDRLTEPSDVSRSSAIEYWITLSGL